MMPLIEIETVPIEMEIKVSPAQLKAVRGTADLEITRDKGGMRIKSQPIKVKLDTYEARSSFYIPASNGQSVERYAQKGQQAAYEATATYAQQGELLLEAKVGQELITQFAADAMSKGTYSDVGIDFVPHTGPKVDWDPGAMKIHFEMDKLNFDWRISQSHFEFVPGDIEISITQNPDVIIKYVGGPLYVPPSSDPNYEPVDVKA